MVAPQNPAHSPELFVRWLRQVAPYVHAFRGRTFVIGFGGELFTERTRFLSFVHDLNLLAALRLMPQARWQCPNFSGRGHEDRCCLPMTRSTPTRTS